MQLHCRNSIQKRFDFLTAESEFESDKNVLESRLQSESGLQYILQAWQEWTGVWTPVLQVWQEWTGVRTPV